MAAFPSIRASSTFSSRSRSETPTWNYVVLAATALFEGTSFGIALRQFRKEVGARPFWRAHHASKDPTTYTVLAADAGALLGLAIAAADIYLIWVIDWRNRNSTGSRRS